MKEKKIKRRATFKRRFEWAIIKREKRTGKIIKTVSLDADSEIPEGVTNFSEYIRGLMKRDKEARAKAKAGQEQQNVKPEAEEPLTEMEEDLYGWMDNWNNMYGFHRLGTKKYGDSYKYLKLEPSVNEMFSLLSAVEDYVSNAKTTNPEHTEHFNEVVAYVQTLRKNRQLWGKVYDKFCKHWREEHPQPEIYGKEALWFDGKSWTGAEVLEKVLPYVDMIEEARLTIKKVAEVFHVSYQVAYNKIVPFISPILNAAGVEMASTE